MRKYKIGLFGNISVRAIEFDEDFISDSFAIDYVERSLKYYYPTFCTAVIWRLSDDGNYTNLAEFSSQVTVTTRRTAG